MRKITNSEIKSIRNKIHPITTDKTLEYSDYEHQVNNVYNNNQESKVSLYKNGELTTLSILYHNNYDTISDLNRIRRRDGYYRSGDLFDIDGYRNTVFGLNIRDFEYHLDAMVENSEVVDLTDIFSKYSEMYSNSYSNSVYKVAPTNKLIVEGKKLILNNNMAIYPFYTVYNSTESLNLYYVIRGSW